MDAPRWVTLTSFSTPLEAHMMRGRLEAEGIAVQIADEHLINADWLMSQALGGVKLQVDAADLARAEALLGELAAAEFEWEQEPSPEPVCPHCGSTEIGEQKTLWRLAMLLFFLEHVPLPAGRGRWQCRHCGHRWQEPSA